jgi:hypothetical protein
VIPIYNPSTQDAEAIGSKVRSQPGLHGQTLSQSTSKILRKVSGQLQTCMFKLLIVNSHVKWKGWRWGRPGITSTWGEWGGFLDDATTVMESVYSSHWERADLKCLHHSCKTTASHSSPLCSTMFPSKLLSLGHIDVRIAHERIKSTVILEIRNCGDVSHSM